MHSLHPVKAEARSSGNCWYRSQPPRATAAIARCESPGWGWCALSSSRTEMSGHDRSPIRFAVERSHKDHTDFVTCFVSNHSPEDTVSSPRAFRGAIGASLCVSWRADHCKCRNPVRAATTAIRCDLRSAQAYGANGRVCMTHLHEWPQCLSVISACRWPNSRTCTAPAVRLLNLLI